MAKLNLEEIKAKADEYAKVAKQLERAEAKRQAIVDTAMQRADRNIRAARLPAKIEKLQEKADSLRAEVIAFVKDKTKTYAAESELATFGVTVGEKQLERQPDKQKLWDLCKKKGVEFFDLVNVMLANADKALGKKEVDEISTRRTVPTRSEYLKLK